MQRIAIINRTPVSLDVSVVYSDSRRASVRFARLKLGTCDDLHASKTRPE